MNSPLLLLVKTSKFEQILSGEYLELDIIGQINETETKNEFFDNYFRQKLFLPRWFLEQKGLLDSNLWKARTFYFTYFPDYVSYSQDGTWSMDGAKLSLAKQFPDEKDKEIIKKEKAISNFFNNSLSFFGSLNQTNKPWLGSVVGVPFAPFLVGINSSEGISSSSFSYSPDSSLFSSSSWVDSVNDSSVRLIKAVSQGHSVAVVRKILIPAWSLEESKILCNLGVDVKQPCEESEFKEYKKVLEYVSIVKQNADELPTGEGEIKKIILFSPPHFQDKDCAVVVSYREMTEQELKLILATTRLCESPMPSEVSETFFPRIWLLVYERPWQNNGCCFYAKQVKSCSGLEDAEKKADELVKELMDKNNPYPACAVFDKVGDVFKSFSIDGNIEGVKGLKIPWSAKNKPEGYFKSLDIVGVETFKGAVDLLVNRYSHVGIYLGKDKNNKHFVAHVTSDPDKAWIADWKELFDKNSHAIHRHHVFVTYKENEIIKDQIARAVASDEYDNNYNFLLRNCQQFANKAVLGLNISNEATLSKKNKPLKNEILETNYHFNHLTISSANQKYYQQEKRKINEYTAQIEYKPLWEWKKPVELKPTDNCKLQ